MISSGRSGAHRPRPKRESSRSWGKKRARLTLIVEEKLWRSDPRAVAFVRRAALEALARCARTRAPRGLTILLTSDARVKELNALFRGRRKATNVLSFPGAEKNYLGDVAIAYGVTAREARGQGKRLSAHGAHLAAHGVLHLLGYNHEDEGEAEVMEALEMHVLARLGLPNPYARARAAA
jgi:probable rRNA maturation factor